MSLTIRATSARCVNCNASHHRRNSSDNSFSAFCSEACTLIAMCVVEIDRLDRIFYGEWTSPSEIASQTCISADKIVF